MRTPAIVALVFIAVLAMFCFHFSIPEAGMGLTAFFFLCLAQEIIDVLSRKIGNK